MSRLRFVFALALLAVPGAVLALDPNVAAPPIAKKVPHKLEQHGDTRIDDYFWIKDKTQALYYCKYEDADANPQALAFQPDWIKEAMGLRVIPEDEASQITVTSAEPAGS